MDEVWRMAFMFDAPGGDVDALAGALAAAHERILSAVGEAQVRTGVADRHADMGTRTRTEYAEQAWRGVDGAIEVTVAASRSGELPAIATALREVVNGLAASGSVEVMTGPMYSMVPPRDGGAFLSLSFKRDPATTSQQFRDWWRYQHAGVAIPVLGDDLLGYDQVHVDPAATEAVARAFGVEPVLYDAYDNLTYVDRYGFLNSVSDAEAMATVFADEVGRIDNSTRRNALMRRVG